MVIGLFGNEGVLNSAVSKLESILRTEQRFVLEYTCAKIVGSVYVTCFEEPRCV